MEIASFSLKGKFRSDKLQKKKKKCEKNVKKEFDCVYTGFLVFDWFEDAFLDWGVPGNTGCAVDPFMFVFFFHYVCHFLKNKNDVFFNIFGYR